MVSSVNVHLREDSRISWDGASSYWVEIHSTDGSSVTIFVPTATDAARLTAALQIARNHA